jgi:hypothetical protein
LKVAKSDCHRLCLTANLTLPGFGPVFFLGLSDGSFSRTALSAAKAVKNATQSLQYADGDSIERTKFLPQRSHILHATTEKLGVAIAAI